MIFEIEQQKQKMLEIGSKYADKACQASSMREAAEAMRISERAFKFAMELDKKLMATHPEDLVDLFLAAISDKAILRSTSYRLYTALCHRMNFLPLRKGEFFRAVEKNPKFKLTSREAGIYIVPPRAGYNPKLDQDKLATVKQLTHEIQADIASH